MAQGHWAHSTIRGYEGSIALFLDYLCDPRYGRAKACMAAVSEVPTQICHEWNTATHVSEHEGRPERRPLSRDECQAVLLHLARHLPAAVLAELLNVGPKTAVHWMAAAGGDWSTYAAQVAGER